MSFYRNQFDLMLGYVSAAIRNANEAVNSSAEKHDLAADRFFSIFIEYIFFFLHLAYRRIYPLTEEKRCEMLMTQMADLAIRMGIDSKGFFLDEQIKHELYDKCVQDFIVTMSDYGTLPEYIEEKDIIYVCQYGKNRVVTFTADPATHLIDTSTLKQFGPTIYAPDGITVDSNYNVYVCSNSNQGAYSNSVGQR